MLTPSDAPAKAAATQKSTSPSPATTRRAFPRSVPLLTPGDIGEKTWNREDHGKQKKCQKVEHTVLRG